MTSTSLFNVFISSFNVCLCSFYLPYVLWVFTQALSGKSQFHLLAGQTMRLDSSKCLKAVSIMLRREIWIMLRIKYDQSATVTYIPAVFQTQLVILLQLPDSLSPEKLLEL